MEKLNNTEIKYLRAKWKRVIAKKPTASLNYIPLSKRKKEILKET